MDNETALKLVEAVNNLTNAINDMPSYFDLQLALEDLTTAIENTE